jgi:uncharacterized Tic20 family protein
MMSEAKIVPPQPDATSNDRLLAALAHGSVILSFFGAVIPALIWSFQRRKSSYVAFHALQAAGYQMLMYWVGLAAYLVIVLVGFFALLLFSEGMPQQSGDNPAGTMALVQGFFAFSIYGYLAIYFLFGIVGAVMCLLDKDFKYPILGKRLEKYLGRGTDPNDALDEAKAEQWMSSMGHASAILLLWGIFTPLALFLAQKDSPRLRFQSAQAAVYQTLATVAFFGFGFCYVVTFFSLFAGVLADQTVGTANSPIQGIALIGFLLIFLILGIFVLLGLPTYHLFAMIAGIQVVKGRDYRYPILGRLIAKRLPQENSASVSEN